MTKKILLSLVAISYTGLFANYIQATSKVAEIKPLQVQAPFFELANGDLSGSLGLQYQYTDTGSKKDINGVANLKYLTSDLAKIRLGLNFYGITDFSAYDNGISRFQNNGKDFSILMKLLFLQVKVFLTVAL